MIRPSPRSTSRRWRSPLTPPGVLHHLAAVLSLSQRRSSAELSGALMRRQRQRLSLAQRLLDPLPEGLRSNRQGSERFWQALRWGGLGLMLAWLLQR